MTHLKKRHCDTKAFHFLLQNETLLYLITKLTEYKRDCKYKNNHALREKLIFMQFCIHTRIVYAVFITYVLLHRYVI